MIPLTLALVPLLDLVRSQEVGVRERALKLLLLSFTAVTTLIPQEGGGTIPPGVNITPWGVGGGGAMLLAGGLDEKQVDQRSYVYAPCTHLHSTLLHNTNHAFSQSQYTIFIITPFLTPSPLTTLSHPLFRFFLIFDSFSFLILLSRSYFLFFFLPLILSSFFSDFFLSGGSLCSYERFPGLGQDPLRRALE